MSNIKNEIPIILACDDNYVKFAAVTIASIMANSSKNNAYKIHILTEYISDNNIQLLKEQINKKRNFSLDLINVSNIDFSKFYITQNSHINISTYYRFFIADLLPQYDKVLYLDCDLVVNIDVANLYNHNLEDNILGAVKDDMCIRIKKLIDNPNEPLEKYPDFTLKYYTDVLKLDTNWMYFNAGVILFNTKIMREINFSAELIAINNEIEKPIFQDQDILNVCVYKNKKYGGKYLVLDKRYNIYGIDVTPLFLLIQKLLKLLNLNSLLRAYIVHFVGSIKPWNGTRNAGQLFYKYLYGGGERDYIISQFRDEIEQYKNFPQQSSLRKFLYKYIF